MTNTVEKQVKISKGYADIVVRHEDVCSYIDVKILDKDREFTDLRGRTSCKKSNVPQVTKRMIASLVR